MEGNVLQNSINVSLVDQWTALGHSHFDFNQGLNHQSSLEHHGGPWREKILRWQFVHCYCSILPRWRCRSAGCKDPDGRSSIQ